MPEAARLRHQHRDALGRACSHGDALLTHSGPGGAARLGDADSDHPAPAGRGRPDAGANSTPSPSAAGRARSPGCAPPARWRRAWASAPACRVLPVDTLHALAEEARHRFGVPGAWWRCSMPAWTRSMPRPTASTAYRPNPARQLLAPEAGAACRPGWVLAGNAFAAYGARLPPGRAHRGAADRRRAMLRLAPALLAAGGAVAPQDATPLYVRDKVAQTTDERAAARRDAAPESGAAP